MTTTPEFRPLLRPNRRELRARMLASSVMKTLGRHLSDIARGPSYDALLELFMTEGVEVLTDHDRTALGLPARSSDGWAPEELVALDALRAKAMLSPHVAVFEHKNDGGN